MDDLTPPGGGPRDPWATEPLWQHAGGVSAHPRSYRGKPWRWVAGIATVALLAAGGVAAGMALGAHPAPAASSRSAPASGAAAGPGASSGAAALLNQTLSSANSPDAVASGTGASGPAAAGLAAGPAAAGAGAAAGRPCARARQAIRWARLTGRRLPLAARLAVGRCRLRVRRVVRFFLLNGVDGQFTLRTRRGLRALAYQRGVVQSVAPGASLVVKDASGATWAWQLVATTVVRDPSGKLGEGALAAGEPVWIGGPVTQGAKDARLIFLRPPGGA